MRDLKKSEHTRSTRERSLTEIKPEAVTAIKEYTERHKIEHMEKEIMACVRTESTTQGGLGKTSMEYAVAAVTPERMRRGSFGTTYAGPPRFHYRTSSM